MQEVKSIMAHHHREPPEKFVDNGVAVFAFPRALGIIEVPALEIAPPSFASKGARPRSVGARAAATVSAG